ncbi:aminotransferase class IV family protein [Dokdonella sp.]|uniref:aminotransferase class IV family protein n=1 Tax=Dokdonella sp. TaxID=2291710 RepID=UPI003528B76A
MLAVADASPVRRVELNGRAPTTAEMAFLAQVNYGHFTSMQVRDGCVRGFGLHLDRLAMATRELFGSELDLERTRGWIRQVLDGRPASLRVTVFSTALDRSKPEGVTPADVLVAASPARIGRASPLRLQSVVYARDLPHIKHVGTFSLFHYLRQARLAGFDDVLFRTRGGEYSEGSTWNIGFWDGQNVIWPTAPALPGVTRNLLDEGLQAAGIRIVSRPVTAAELPALRSAFVMNAGWVGPQIECIDEFRLSVDPQLDEILGAAYESRPWEKV